MVMLQMIEIAGLILCKKKKQQQKQNIFSKRK